MSLFWYFFCCSVSCFVYYPTNIWLTNDVLWFFYMPRLFLSRDTVSTILSLCLFIWTQFFLVNDAVFQFLRLVSHSCLLFFIFFSHSCHVFNSSHSYRNYVWRRLNNTQFHCFNISIIVSSCLNPSSSKALCFWTIYTNVDARLCPYNQHVRNFASHFESIA